MLRKEGATQVSHPPKGIQPAATRGKGTRTGTSHRHPCEQLHTLHLLEARDRGLHMAGKQAFLPCLLAPGRTNRASLGGLGIQAHLYHRGTGPQRPREPDKDSGCSGAW